jgi:hypothetical protein
MRKFYLTISILISAVGYSIAQPFFNQYFDGADTSATNSIIIRKTAENDF